MTHLSPDRGQFGYRELLYGKPIFCTDLPIAMECTPVL